MSQAPRCEHGEEERGVFCPKCHPKRYGELAASTRSLSGIGSEILIAQWKARVETCEQTAASFQKLGSEMAATYLEKARAFRACIEDLHRQMAHESKRQPTENSDSATG